MKSFILFLISLFLPFLGLSQLSQGGLPPSFSYDGTITIPHRIMPTIDTESLRAEDERNRRRAMPYRFGYTFETNFSLNSSGIWTTLDNGDKIWHLQITCPDALAVKLMYKDFYLPEGAQFFVYNQEQILGAFTNKNNKQSRKFATASTKGESAILEYYEPSNVAGQGSISLEKVTHVYRGRSDNRDFGDSGACNVNVNCPQGSGWESQRDAVARIDVGGGWCTGTLINNTAQDGKLYFLTANHCLGGLDAEGNTDASQWVFYWNYESINCTNPMTEPTTMSTTGAILRANSQPSDFALLELTEDPFNNVNIQAYFAGWNRESTPTAGASLGIHHPSGDIKKLCVENQALTTSISTINVSGLDYPAGSLWIVDTWDTGVTEGGSSGSALFDSNKRIVGQLLGGQAACGNPINDFYGKISTSWEGQGTNTRRLKNWLDPNNSGVMQMDGTAGTGGGNCAITVITAGNQTNCDQNSNTYSQDVTITFNDAPASGNLVVNGQNFAIGTSPQTVTLTSLTADGQAVEVTAQFVWLNLLAVLPKTVHILPLKICNGNGVFYVKTIACGSYH